MAGDFNNFVLKQKKNRARFLTTTKSIIEKYEELDQTGELDSVLDISNFAVISDKKGVLKKYVYSGTQSYKRRSDRRSDYNEKRESSRDIQDKRTRETSNRSPGLMYTDIDEFEETFELSKDLPDDVTSFLQQSMCGEAEPSDAESLGSSDSYETVGSGYADSDDSDVATDSLAATTGTSQVDSHSQESSQDESVAVNRDGQSGQRSTPKQQRHAEATMSQNSRPVRNETYTINQTSGHYIQRDTSPHLSPYRRRHDRRVIDAQSSPFESCDKLKSHRSESHSIEHQQETVSQGICSRPGTEPQSIAHRHSTQSHGTEHWNHRMESDGIELRQGMESHSIENCQETISHSIEHHHRTGSRSQDHCYDTDLKSKARHLENTESHFHGTKPHLLEKLKDTVPNDDDLRHNKKVLPNKNSDYPRNNNQVDNRDNSSYVRASYGHVTNKAEIKQDSPRQMAQISRRRDSIERPANVNELFQELKENLHLEESYAVESAYTDRYSNKGYERNSPRKRGPLTVNDNHNKDNFTEKRETIPHGHKRVVRRIVTQFTPFDAANNQESLNLTGVENAPRKHLNQKPDFDRHRDNNLNNINHNRISPKDRSNGKDHFVETMQERRAVKQKHQILNHNNPTNQDHRLQQRTSDERSYRSPSLVKKMVRGTPDKLGHERLEEERIIYIEEDVHSCSKTNREAVVIDKHFGQDIRRASTPNQRVRNMTSENPCHTYQLKSPPYQTQSTQKMPRENVNTHSAFQSKSTQCPLNSCQQHSSVTPFHLKQARENVVNKRNFTESIPMSVTEIRDSGINTTYEDSAIGNSMNSHPDQPKSLTVKNLHSFEKAMQKHSFIMEVSMNASALVVNVEESVDKVEKWLFGVEESQNVADCSSDNVKTSFNGGSGYINKHNVKANQGVQTSKSAQSDRQGINHYRRTSSEVDFAERLNRGDNRGRASKGGNDVKCVERRESTLETNHHRKDSQTFYDEVDSMNVMTRGSPEYRNRRNEVQSQVNEKNCIKQDTHYEYVKLFSPPNKNHQESSEQLKESSEERVQLSAERHYKERRHSGGKSRQSQISEVGHHQPIKMSKTSSRYWQNEQRSPGREQQQKRYPNNPESGSPRERHHSASFRNEGPTPDYVLKDNQRNRQPARSPNNRKPVDIEHKTLVPNIRFHGIEGIDDLGNLFRVDTVQRDGRLKLKIRRSKRSLDKMDGLRHVDVGEQMRMSDGNTNEDFNERRQPGLANKRPYDEIEVMDCEEDLVPVTKEYQSEEVVPTPPKARRLHISPRNHRPPQNRHTSADFDDSLRDRDHKTGPVNSDPQKTKHRPARCTDSLKQGQPYDRTTRRLQSNSLNHYYIESPNVISLSRQSHRNELHVNQRHTPGEQVGSENLESRQSHVPTRAKQHSDYADCVEYDSSSDIVVIESGVNSCVRNHGNNSYEIRSPDHCGSKSRLSVQNSRRHVTNNFNSPKGSSNQPHVESSEFRSPNIERQQLVSSNEDFSPSASMSKLRLNTPRSKHRETDLNGRSNTKTAKSWKEFQFTDSNKALDNSRHTAKADSDAEIAQSSSRVYRHYYQATATERSNGVRVEKASSNKALPEESHRMQPSSKQSGYISVKRKSPQQSRKPDYDMTDTINCGNINALERSISERLSGESSRHQRHYSGPQGLNNRSSTRHETNSRLNMSYDSRRMNLNSSRIAELDPYEDASPGFVSLDSLSGTKSHVRVQMQQRTDMGADDGYRRHSNVFHERDHRHGESSGHRGNERTHSTTHSAEYNETFDNIESVSTVGNRDVGGDNMSTFDGGERLDRVHPQERQSLKNMCQGTSSPKMRKELFSPKNAGGRTLSENKSKMSRHGQSPDVGFKVPGTPSFNVRHSKPASTGSHGQNMCTSAHGQSVTVKRAEISQLSTRDRLKHQLNHQNKSKPFVPPEFLQSTPIKPSSKFSLDVSMSTIMGSEEPKSDGGEISLI